MNIFKKIKNFSTVKKLAIIAMAVMALVAIIFSLAYYGETIFTIILLGILLIIIIVANGYGAVPPMSQDVIAAKVQIVHDAISDALALRGLRTLPIGNEPPHGTIDYSDSKNIVIKFSIYYRAILPETTRRELEAAILADSCEYLESRYRVDFQKSKQAIHIHLIKSREAEKLLVTVVVDKKYIYAI